MVGMGLIGPPVGTGFTKVAVEVLSMSATCCGSIIVAVFSLLLANVREQLWLNSSAHKRGGQFSHLIGNGKAGSNGKHQASHA